MSAPAATLPMSLLQAEGVLFDFNGTLSDDEGILRDLFIHLAATELGLHLTSREYQEELAGRSDREILDDLITRTPATTREKVNLDRLLPLIDQEYQARVTAESTISPATRELVRVLHGAGLKLGVVTGASRLQVLPALERAELLECFGVVVTDEDVVEGKPHPEGFLRAAEILGLKDPSKVVAFEDSLPGLGAVASAGMIAICVEGTHPRHVLEQHASILISEISTSCLELDLTVH